jgi:hypothetical protein
MGKSGAPGWLTLWAGVLPYGARKNRMAIVRGCVRAGNPGCTRSLTSHESNVAGRVLAQRAPVARPAHRGEITYSRLRRLATHTTGLLVFGPGSGRRDQVAKGRTVDV